MPDEDSKKLLESLYKHMQKKEFIYQHKWQVGDVMVWDNRCTQHQRLAFDQSYRRTMKRTQVAGTATF